MAPPYGNRRTEMAKDMPPTPSSSRKGTQQAGKASGLNLLALLVALRRHLLLACVLSAIAGGLAGAGVWFFLPPGKHEVTRVLHVSSTTPVFAFEPQRG